MTTIVKIASARDSETQELPQSLIQLMSKLLKQIGVGLELEVQLFQVVITHKTWIL